jgi:predicted permease
MNRLISAGEFRLGLRLILKQPILSFTVILALATGISVATIGFTFRDELVNGRLPYQAGDRFARIHAVDREGNRLAPDPERYRAFRDRAASFEYVGAIHARPFTLSHGPADVESVRGAFITPGWMAWVEASPLSGRTLIQADGNPGAERVVLVRESLWRRRYSGDPNLIGRQLTIAGQRRTVVGIMPDSFRFPDSGELWLPLDESMPGGMPQQAAGIRAYGVTRPGVSFESATTELSELSRQFPARDEPGQIARVIVQPFTGGPEEAGLAAGALVFVLVMLLLVVASNVSTLIFARSWSRAPELAVRTALGATRARVVGQLFLETLLLGSIATVIGSTSAFAIMRYVTRAYISDIPFWITLEPTWRIVAFAAFLAVLVSAVAGLWPALRVTRHDLRNSLQAGRGFAAGGFGRVGAALLVVEIALSVGLLNAAVTMARAFDSYMNEVPALPRNQVLTVKLGRIESAEWRDRVVAATAAIPGVVAAGAGGGLPRIYPMPRPTAVEAIGDEPIQAAMPAPSHAVGAGFLEAIGARTLSGRLFAAADFVDGAAPVAVVNEPFVRKFLGGRNPIGRRIRIEEPREDGTREPWREIVGVVPDLGLSVANASLAAGFYTPVRDEFLYYLAVRTTTDPLKLVPQLRAAVANLNPDLQLEEFRTLEDAGEEERAVLSTVSAALTVMGGIALLLSVVGIYALLSFMVTRRTREIGIRVALGARSMQILRTVTGGAIVHLAIGGTIGTALGLLVLQLRSVLLISIPDAGVLMPASIFLILALAGGMAGWLPARRALGIRPSEALNAD